MTTDPSDTTSTPPRDPRFDAAWRAASHEEPPAALDAAILGASRRAVGARPQPADVREATRPERWWWPLAAAASIGAVAIGILQLATQDRAGGPDPRGAIVSDMPAERPAAVPSAPSTAPSTAPPAAQSNAPPPASSPASDAVAPAAEVAAPRVMERDAARPAALGKVLPAAGARGDARAGDRPPLPVAEWIALIRKLRAEGKTEELAREVAAFKAAYPDQQHLLADDRSSGGERAPPPAR